MRPVGQQAGPFPKPKSEDHESDHSELPYRLPSGDHLMVSLVIHHAARPGHTLGVRSGGEGEGSGILPNSRRKTIIECAQI